MNSFKNKVNKAIGIINWSLIRHKYYIPVFIIVQLFLAFAMIYGFSFIVDFSNIRAKTYLYTGTIAINIIAVSNVLAPQIMSEAKINGVLEYQKSLPISMNSILISDIIIWGVIILPGIIFSSIIGSFKFDIDIYFSLKSIFSLIFIIVSLLLVGFAIAIFFPANILNLITQIIMIGGLLFSPIIYSAEKLPKYLVSFYNILPFVPISNIIRNILFHIGSFNIIDYIVVLFWALLSYISAIYMLHRRI